MSEKGVEHGSVNEIYGKEEEVPATAPLPTVTDGETEDETDYPTGPKLYLITLALALSVFLFALVRLQQFIVFGDEN
jgi:hypothetical protein